MTRIYLIRHGETEWNKTKKIQGQMNTDLTKRGIQQAEKIGKRLKDEKIDIIYTSDLSRAYETALIIGNIIKTKVDKLESLREINFGPWQGLTIHEVKKLYKKEHSIWMSEPHKLIIEGAESLLELKERIMATVNQLIHKHQNENIAIVAHSAVIKIMILSILDIDISYYSKIALDNASLSIIEYREYNAVIRLLNDTCHLREV